MIPCRALLAAALLGLLAATPGAATAADQPSTLSARSPSVTWHGSVSAAAPLGCGQPNLGCDTTQLVVQAPKGAWLTVSVDTTQANLRITAGRRLVAAAGQTQDSNPDARLEPTTTFQQIRGGRVTYDVAVGDQLGNPVTAYDYTATARLAGTAFDRAGDCGVTPGTEHVLDSGSTPTRPLAVRLVAEPKDSADVRRAGAGLKEIYARIGVPVTVSYDFRRIPPYQGYPFEGVRQVYGGVRPAGIDVVHVMTDDFAGGYAACIGGVAYAEKAFSVGNVHYTVQGTVAVSQVPGALVAAHEIGHLLGAQHQQFNCVEAAPQQAQQPASDGWVGPCTLMGPAAVQASETFSTLERTTIRHFVTSYAGGR